MASLIWTIHRMFLKHPQNGSSRGTFILLLANGPQGKVSILICPEFPLDLTGFFPGKHLIQLILANKMQDLRDFVH